MKPTKQIGKGVEANILLRGEEGSDYQTLPVLRTPGDMRGFVWTSRWKLTWKERLQLLFTGSIWLHTIGTGHPPISLELKEPMDITDHWRMLQSEQEEDEV